MFHRVSRSPAAAAIVASASLCLVGCSPSPDSGRADSTAVTPAVPTETASAAAAVSLAGNPWHWVATQTPVEWIVADDPARYTVQFNADSSLFLRADCNRGRGTYVTTADRSLTIGPAALTRAMCPPGSLDTKFLQQLNNAAGWFFRDDTLYIDQKMDSGTMRFVRDPAASE